MGTPDGRERLYPALRSAIECCRQCELSVHRTRAVPGEGDIYARLMFVGEAPGEKEDLHGLPFVGQAGKLLDSLIEGILGLSRKTVYITNVVKCRPPGNRDPLPPEIEACRAYLMAQVALVMAEVICILGRHSLHTLLDPNWNISAMHGRPIQKNGITFFPAYHPAAALYRPEMKEELARDFEALKALLAREA